MDRTSETALLDEPARVSPPAAWRWVHVGVSALAMVATLPGRTHGLGLFTEPIRNSLGLSKESYGFLNTGATLLGALFCLPCGWLIDRLGTRAVLTTVMVALGAVVLAMSRVTGSWAWQFAIPLPGGFGSFAVILPVSLFLLVLLTRGLGQSALSVASLSLIGRSAGRRAGLAVGVYAFLTSAGFLAAFWVLGEVVKQHPTEWRPAWAGIGAAVIAAGVLSGLLVRDRPLDAEEVPAPRVPHASRAGGPRTNLFAGLRPARQARGVRGAAAADEPSLTLGQALRSPAFWTFGLAVSFFGMVSAGTSLFNETILNDLRFDKRVFVNVTRVGIPVGLASNLLGGWLAARWSLSHLLALALGGLAAALGAFPRIQTEAQVYAYAAVLAAAGGVITVCFFTVWRRDFGPAHLGQVQGAAQMLTVLFSALGPQLFGSTRDRLGSYLPLFPYLAAISLGLALATWLAGLPRRGYDR